jgi:hypothetical protein
MTTKNKAVPAWMESIGRFGKTVGGAIARGAVLMWKALVRAFRAVARWIRWWWKLGDGYQQKGRGWAVSGFIFSLLNLFLLGFVPPLSYLAVVCCVVALCKHNRALISVLGIALGVLGIWLSGQVYEMVHLYAADPAALQALLEGWLGEARDTVSGNL